MWVRGLWGAWFAMGEVRGFSGRSASPGNCCRRWAGLGVWPGASERGDPSGSIAALRSPWSIPPQRPLFPEKHWEPLQRSPPSPLKTDKTSMDPWERGRQKGRMLHLHLFQSQNPPPPPIPTPTRTPPSAPRQHREGRGAPKKQHGSAKRRSIGSIHQKKPTPPHSAGPRPLPRRGLRPLPCHAAGVPLPASP